MTQKAQSQAQTIGTGDAAASARPHRGFILHVPGARRYQGPITTRSCRSIRPQPLSFAAAPRRTATPI